MSSAVNIKSLALWNKTEAEFMNRVNSIGDNKAPWVRNIEIINFFLKF